MSENDVTVVDANENQILYTCSIKEIEKAYHYAKQMEELGVEVQIKTPSVPESLARELGASEESISILKDEINEEILSHEGSCCDEK